MIQLKAKPQPKRDACLDKITLALTQEDGDYVVSRCDTDEEILSFSQNGVVDMSEDWEWTKDKDDTDCQKYILEMKEPAPCIYPRGTYITLFPFNGDIRVIAVDQDGKRLPDGNLFRIKANGSIYAYHTVNPALGFELDGDGRIAF